MRLKDCYAEFDGKKLVIGNSVAQRVFDMTEDIPTVESLFDKRLNKEWISTKEVGQWENGWPKEKKYAFFKTGFTEGKMDIKAVGFYEDDDCGIGETALCAQAELGFDGCVIRWTNMVYPQLPVFRSFIEVTGTDAGKTTENTPALVDDICDCIPLAVEHCRWERVCFHDRTDDNETLVETTGGLLSRREKKEHEGNIFFAKDYFNECGVIMVKEGPTPEGRLPQTQWDFVIRGFNIYCTGWGIDVGIAENGETLKSYASAVILWNGGEKEALLALHSYQRARRTFVPERDAFIMANTWGDGNADGRISEEFLLTELQRAAELGITFYQIDDGWEKGTTINSVNAAGHNGGAWSYSYYDTDPEFWEVNTERLPNGLEPIAEFAKEKGIVLGIWFSPDSVRDFENWERDAEVLIGLHRKYGIVSFKLDGLMFESKRGEERFAGLMRKVVTECEGKVFFNLDTTAGIRNGYFGQVQYGDLFLENRFTNAFGRWPNYWPHRTLRNLWMLCRYIPGERLQTEFLNTDRNEELYGDDPIAPAKCGIEYAFATAMMGSPLAWMELSALSEENTKLLKAQINAFGRVQADILSGTVLPIGNEPDGKVWTGFQSLKESDGYILIFRENTDKESEDIYLWGTDCPVIRLECIAGDGRQKEAIRDEAGRYRFTLTERISFALYRYKPV